jgi:hypothetical protein
VENGWNPEEGREDSETVQCQYCDQQVTETEVVVVQDDVWCTNCFENHGTMCDRCEENVDSDCTYTVDEYRTWCQTCVDRRAWSCDNCGDLNSEYATSYEVDGHESWCDDCVNTYCSWCEECEVWTTTECEAEHDDGYSYRGPHIETYSYKPVWTFNRAAGEPAGVSGRPYFGVELETEAGSNATKQAGADLWHETFGDDDRLILKEDGSISRGFEIVSHPHSLNAWRGFDAFDQYLDGLWKLGFSAYGQSTVGLHVHVNKASFDSTNHRAKFNALIAMHKQDWVENIAWRETGYADFNTSRPHQGWYENITLKQIVNGKTSHTAAVNWSNDKTTEIRIFRPALALSRVVGCVESVAATQAFARVVTARDLITWNSEPGSTFEHLLDFASGEYPEFVRQARMTPAEHRSEFGSR